MKAPKPSKSHKGQRKIPKVGGGYRYVDKSSTKALKKLIAFEVFIQRL